ncbi:MAG: DMT family transporter [Myxococcaceae bacterium]|nr:DMT family transporter [Myxococcaceae bacterium]
MAAAVASRPLSAPAAHALLHVTVLVWGFTAILGRLISLSAVPLVWYRLLVVLPVMALVLRLKRLPFGTSARTTKAFWAIGVLVALHWLCFYGCIKYAGVAVAVLCLSSLTFFTALLEPLVYRRALVPAELLIGLAAIAGVSLLVKFETNATPLGLALGLFSALFSAGFGTLNGVWSRGEPAERVTLHELSSALLVTSLGFVAWDFVPPWALSARDALWLALLGVGCTVFPWLASLKVLETLSPYTLALAVTLEPVYSLVLAFFLFPGEEQLTARFYAGAAGLLGLVLLNAWIKRSRAPQTTVESVV